MKLILSSKNISKKINDILTDNRFLNEVGKEVVFDIQRNARTGRTIDKNGNVGKMEPLAPSTLDHREYLERAGNAKASPYSNKLSNLSMSGQLIDSIVYQIKSSAIIIWATGIRTRYRLFDGSLSKSKRIPTNAELLAYHQKGVPSQNLPARPIIGLRNQMKQRIFIKIKEYLRRK